MSTSRGTGVPGHQRLIQRGLSLIEFAILSALLLAMLAGATDYSLSILARQEIHGAARAGMEFAINEGYDPKGIEAAARGAQNPSVIGLRSAAITRVSSTSKCACYADLANAVDPTASTASSPAVCPGLCPPPQTGDLTVSQGAYATVKVEGTYAPYFGLFWVGLVNGKVEMAATYVGKTFFTK